VDGGALFGLGLLGGLLVGALLEVLLGGSKVLREECASHLLLLNEGLLQLILGCTMNQQESLDDCSKICSATSNLKR
jgi:hypothetical protein